MQFKKKKGKIGRDWNSRLKGNCNSCSQSYCTLLHSEENVVLNHLIFIVKFLIYENKMNDKRILSEKTSSPKRRKFAFFSYFRVKRLKLM